MESGVIKFAIRIASLSLPEVAEPNRRALSETMGDHRDDDESKLLAGILMQARVDDP